MHCSLKIPTINPVHNIPGAIQMTDFHPVAKCMERIVCTQLTTSVADRIDPLLFTYRASRGVKNATLTLVDLMSSHLDKAGTSVIVLFMDMSAAFQTNQHHLLIQILLDLDVNSDLVLWIRQFLCDRSQCISLNAVKLVKPVLSDEMVVNTGAHQGCVLSPVRFSLYAGGTHGARCHR